MAPAISRIFAPVLGARSDIASLGPLAARTVLLARNPAEEHHEPGAGVVPPQKINNNAVFAVFGLLGAGFVIVGIWFFFWAKNGGFYFKKGDWEDYKSTVLRRKGPNGTIYSGATPSTILGGGSVYKDVDDGTTTTGDDLTTVVSATTGITGITGGVSDISGREKRRKKREQKEREKERRREEKAREKEERRKKKSRRKVDADGVIVDEEAEAQAEEQLRSYRHEKPARVGGINREADGSTWDGSTNPSWSTMSPSRAGGDGGDGADSTVTSDLISNRERTPTNTPTKKKPTEPSSEEQQLQQRAAAGRIRKVYSTADKNAMRENERIRAEARRLQEKGRSHVASSSASASASAAHPEQQVPLRRDFSFVSGADETMALRRIDEVSEVGSAAAAADRHEAARARARERARSRSRHRRSAVASEEGSSGGGVPGSWVPSEVGESDVGTKVYRHPHHIPTASELSSASSSAAAPSSVAGGSEYAPSYAEEKRRRRRTGEGAGARRSRE